jgi:hypothetical protein
MYWVYAGYVVLSIVAFSLLSVRNAHATTRSTERCVEQETEWQRRA